MLHLRATGSGNDPADLDDAAIFGRDRRLNRPVRRVDPFPHGDCRGGPYAFLVGDLPPLNTAAKAIGLTLPLSLLGRAEVIDCVRQATW